MFVYGAIMLILGILGYWQGSLVSLIAGAGFGILLIISSRVMFSHKPAGIYAATAFTLILTATFAVRYTVTQKTVPGDPGQAQRRNASLFIGASC